jgi:hypothetical protein
MAQYRALVGIDYPPNKRAEAGDVVTDLPGDAIKWLLEDGLIEDASKPAKKVETPVVEETPLTVIDLSDGISAEEAELIVSSTPEAETIVSEEE